MSEKENYTCLPLKAAEEVFGSDYQLIFEKGEEKDNLTRAKKNLADLKKRDVLEIKSACLALVKFPYATEMLAYMISINDTSAILRSWNYDPEIQRDLLGFMVEAEMGVIRGWMHLDKQGELTEWNQQRIDTLTKFRDLLFEQQTSSGEIIK